MKSRLMRRVSGMDCWQRVLYAVAITSVAATIAASSGCGASAKAQRTAKLAVMSQGVAVAADVAARSASAIEKWATAREMDIARLAPSREVGEQMLRDFERQMAQVDKAVALASLAIEAAALSVSALIKADEGDLLTAGVAVKAAWDAVRAVQAAVAAVKL